MPDKALLTAAYKKTFKLALATSIIRSKPSHLSAREYAQQLAQQIKSIEASWKSKCDKASEELLEAKQQIVLLQLKNQALSQTSGNFGAVGSISNNNNNNSNRDTNNNNSYNDRSNYRDHNNKSSSNNNNNKKNSNQSSGNDKNDNKSSNNDEDSQIETPIVLPEKQKIVYGNFLSSITTFKEWNVTLQDNRRSMAAIKESMCTSLRQFHSSLDKIPLNDHNFILLSDYLKAMTQVAKKVVPLDKDVTLCYTNIIEKLLGVMTATGNRKQTTTCEKMGALLVLLGQSTSALRDMVLEKLVNAVCSYATLLADSARFTALDVNTYEVMYFICEAVAQLFNSTRPRWPYEKQVAVAKQLDEKMMPISGRYPMFAHEMWILSTLMADNSKGRKADHSKGGKGVKFSFNSREVKRVKISNNSREGKGVQSSKNLRGRKMVKFPVKELRRLVTGQFK